MNIDVSVAHFLTLLDKMVNASVALKGLNLTHQLVNAKQNVFLIKNITQQIKSVNALKPSPTLMENIALTAMGNNISMKLQNRVNIAPMELIGIRKRKNVHDHY